MTNIKLTIKHVFGFLKFFLKKLYLFLLFPLIIFIVYKICELFFKVSSNIQKLIYDITNIKVPESAIVFVSILFAIWTIFLLMFYIIDITTGRE